jgi:hypothetical protein
MKAIWNGVVLAESDQTVVVEGNHYFPPEAIHQEYFRNSQTHTTCHWKGEASYYDIVVGDKVNPDAAWYYRRPKRRRGRLKGMWRSGRVFRSLPEANRDPLYRSSKSWPSNQALRGRIWVAME